MTTSFNISPPIIAHRGASASAPENTRAAFIRAAQMGATWIEFDVMLAACGTPIVFHDETLERTTTGRGEVSQYPYSYLQTLDAGSWFSPAFSGEVIPSLATTLELLSATQLCANIEIKALPHQEEELVVRVLEVLSAYAPAMHSTILFSSFSIDALRFLRKHSPHCLLGLLMHEWIPTWDNICSELQCASVHANEAIMTPERIVAVRQQGYALLCYTVNAVERASYLFNAGVNAVFTDVPDQLIAGLMYSSSR